MMKTYMTRLFTVLMLAMVSMGAWADVKIFYGEKGEELKNGETKIKADNGTIAIEQKASSDGSQTTVNLTFTPNSGYTISTDNIEVYAVISPNSGSTRAPEISGDPLKLSEESSKDPEKRYSVKIDSKLGLWVKKAEFVSGSKGNRDAVTYTYYALHNKDKGYLRQYKGIVGNDGTFRYNTHDDNGSSIWVYSSDGYLQQEMYYLNVLNGQTLVLSTTPVTQWDRITDDDKTRFQLRGSTKILGFDGSKVVLADSPTYKYAACTLTVTENNNKWEGPKDVSWTVQSPQLVTYLRTYYLRNITVKIDKNDKGEENVQVGSGDSRCYCSLTYDGTQDTPNGKGDKWDINTTTGIIYNISSDNKQQTAVAKYILTPLNPIVLIDHPATPATVTIKVNAKALLPDASKKYLLFSTQDGNYRFPKASSSISEGDLLPVDGKQSDLTETVNGDISWVIEVDDEGFYSFKNVTTGYYLYYDATDYTVSDYGAVKIGSETPSSDIRYKFRLYSNAGNRDPFGGCLYIIPYDKQFAVWKSDGVLGEIYFALYMNTSGGTQIASIYKTSDNAKWKIYAYEWEYRLWDNWSISGDQNLYATGNHSYTASTWFSRNIKGSPTNAEHLMLPNSKTHNGITYTWTLTGFNDYISTSNELASGTSTMTASVNSLPPGTRTGTLTVKASISSPASKNNSKSIPINLHNLNPTLTEISKLSEITDANGLYKLTANNVYSSENKPVEDFSGTLDGGGFTISGLTAPLFTTLDGGTVRNLNLDNISINSGDGDGNTGAIACVAKEAARIYNVGILSGSVGGTGYTGGLIGQLNGSARVINCFSYANITGGTEVGGIVGYNNYESKANDIRTMVMNCMFYGDITGGTTVSPVYGGKNINNLQGGLNTFNYYSYDKATNFNNFSEGDNKKYNCALAVEEKYLNRFEYYRLLLNSNKKLAAFYVTGSADNAGQMAKWVLETADRTIESPKPYPVLKAQGYYPSIVNIDADNAPSLTLKDGKPKEEDRKKGGKLGTLSVTIRTKSEKTDGGQSWPTAADVQTTSLPTVVRTDMDEDRFNFNYDKIQLPYYNDVGTGNYTENRVVTGWKITDITTLADDPYTISNYDYTKTYSDGYFDYPNYNFADRKSSNKDKYSISGRVFSQGAYFDVPYGVTSITIEPYWAKAAYIADPNYDAVYDTGYTKQNVTQTGTQVGNSTMFDGEKLGTTGQVVKTSISAALSYISSNLGGYGSTVYDNAVVLVGNFHQTAIPSNGTNPFTMMSVDIDKDNEPDYSMTYHHTGKLKVCPIRFDFLNIPGTAQAQKPNGADKICNMAIIHPSAWFEITNTSSIYFSQLEYEDKVDNENKTEGPLILQGGIIDQIVSANKNPHNGKTIYVHVGGNVWFKEFNIGIHGDGSNATAHVPVSVTGGDYESFYLTGIYNQDASVKTDNAECYISGGHFKEVAGAGQEAIDGSVRWQIYDADIDNFYGGGTNGATGKNIKGDVTVDIFNSHVTTFCGGPKFGNMESGKKVTTKAEGCVFGKFFGAGYGGTAYSRKKYYDLTSTDWSGWAGKYVNDRGKYFDGSTTQSSQQGGGTNYGKKGIGVVTDFDYEFFVWSGGDTGGRFFVKFASFSLAQCNEVESNLTNCTINENFYGGGKLGKVAGTVTSVLDGCTVKGNVFGAGFSASMDPVPVRDAGFGEKKPTYNKKSGMFEPADWSGTTPFTWKHVDSYPSNGGDGFDLTNSNDPKVITTVDLSESNLGSVDGNVTLTLKGDTKVGTMVTTENEETHESVTTLTSGTGNVYGGGESSYVTGAANKVTVNIEGTTHVYGNVFGGGDEGVVEGSTEVNIMYTKPTPTPEP